jgi:hypothetical protein
MACMARSIRPSPHSTTDSVQNLLIVTPSPIPGLTPMHCISSRNLTQPKYRLRCILRYIIQLSALRYNSDLASQSVYTYAEMKACLYSRKWRMTRTHWDYNRWYCSSRTRIMFNSCIRRFELITTYIRARESLPIIFGKLKLKFDLWYSYGIVDVDHWRQQKRVTVDIQIIQLPACN